MEGDFEPLTMKDRWRILSDSFKISTGLLAFVCLYFLLVGAINITSCPAQPNLPWWMIIIGVLIIVERFITVPLFIKKFKLWQQERYQAQLDAETAAQAAAEAANQGFIIDPSAPQTPLVPPPPKLTETKKEKTPIIAKAFVVLSIVASLFGTAFIIHVFFEHPSGCSLFVLLPVTIYCTTNLCFLVLFTILFSLKYRRQKIAQATAERPVPPRPRIMAYPGARY